MHYLDKEIEKILPERKIIFSLVNGIESPENIKDEMSKKLVKKQASQSRITSKYISSRSTNHIHRLKPCMSQDFYIMNHNMHYNFVLYFNEEAD